MRAKPLLAIVVIAWAASALNAAAAGAAVASVALTPTQQRAARAIGGQVNCLCGCLTTVNRCPHLHCAMKAQEKGFIAADLRAGKPPRKVIQDLVLRYGVKILPSPPARGFNLTAWVLPGFGLMIGLVIAVDIARRWRRHSDVTPSTERAPVDPKVLAAIEEEMRKTVG
jgi:cytochrome c-type biogenesis protein CcmH